MCGPLAASRWVHGLFRGGRRVPSVALTSWVVLALFASVVGAQTDDISRVKLSGSVEESLAQLQDRWLLLNSAVLRGDESLAESAVEELLANIDSLGFERAPDLSLAMVVRGVEAGRQGDAETASLAFRLAERIDGAGPAVHFGRSRVAWESGQGLSALSSHFKGLRTAFRLPAFRRLALANSMIWLLLSLLITAAVFLAIQFATKGASLFRDLGALVRRLPKAATTVVAVLLLASPLLLAHGWLWGGLIWGVLLFSYGSPSERWLIATSIVLLGGVPTAFNVLAQSQPVGRGSELRFLDGLETSSLYGRFLDDLADFEQSYQDRTAVEQLLGDIHQSMGQDTVARPYYRRVVDSEPQNGTALNNLGAFHARRRERVAAIDFLHPAALRPESAAAAGYNLSRLYDQLLEFGNSQRYLRLAREASSEDVERWEEAGEDVVSLQGGYQRLAQIRAAALASDPLSRRGVFELSQPLILALAALLLAVVVRWLGLGSGLWRAPEQRLDTRLGRWVRNWMPGLRSAEAGDGTRGFLAVLVPVAVVMWPAARLFGFSLPWGLEPGRGLLTIVTVLFLSAYFGWRAWDR